MKKIIYLLTSRTLWVFLGVLGLAILIWFFGPLLAIGAVKPLENRIVRLIFCLFIISIWVFRFFYKEFRKAKRNALLINEIKEAQEPILKHIATDSIMSRQFAEIDQVLKDAKFSKSKSSILSKINGGQYLYQMPWYVVLGPAGSGKTTALKQSGLNFPLESSFGTSISGLAGTRDCDWFLTDEAVLLDTAGRLSLHGEQDEHDIYDWKEFINLLKRYRPKQPINGVVVTVSVDDLLNNELEFKQLATELRKRINEMISNFGINFPVYLMVTKLDILNGFNEFFNNLTNEQKLKCLGFDFSTLSNDDDPEFLIGYVAKKLSEIEDDINASSLQILSNLPNIQTKNAAFIFADELAKLNENLVKLFRELYKSSKFEKPILWRGIYFTSAKQDGNQIDPILNELSEYLDLSKKYVDSYTTSQSIESYFLHNLFTDVIFKEANLASENKAWFVRHQALYWIGTGVITSLSILYIILMVNSYFNNKDYLHKISLQAESLQQEANSIKQTSDLLQAVEFAEKVKKVALVDNLNIDSPPLSYKMGFYQGDTMTEIANSTYQHILQDSVMPLISYKLDELLRQSITSNDIDSYNALKAYLMMFDKEHFDADFMNTWLMRYFEKSSDIKNDEQKQKIEDALKYILSKQRITPSVPYDKDLVDERRQSIAKNDIATMILKDTYFEITQKDNTLKQVSFSTLGGHQTRLAFVRKSGKPLTAPINAMYTKEAYMEYILPGLLKSTAKLYNEEDWVLGPYASTKTNEIEILKEAQKKYFDNYINTWKDYLSDLALKKPQNLRTAIDIAKVLSDSNNSPLANIIEGISDNTTLALSAQIKNKSNNTIEEVVKNLLTKAGLGNLSSTAENVKTNYLESMQTTTPVDKVFMDYHLLTNTKENKQSSINEVIISIKDLYEYLDVLNIAVEKGVDLPSNNSLFRYRAEVNRLPSPFREMFDQFSDFILNKSLDEISERTRLAEEELEEKKQQEKEEALLEQQKLEEQEAQRQQEMLEKKEEDFIANMEKQLAPLTQECQEVLKQGYPFSKTASTDVNINLFTKIFGTDGNYSNFLKSLPETVNLSGINNFDDIIIRRNELRNQINQINKTTSITKTYFSILDNKPMINFSIRVLNLDKNIDRLVIEYDKQKNVYSHGPIVPINLVWPTKNTNSLSSLTIFKGNNTLGNIKERGDWSIFRLVEKGTLVKKMGNEMIISYDINGEKIILGLTTDTSINPFNLELLRSIQCS